MESDIRGYVNGYGGVNLSTWRKLDGDTEVDLPTDKRLYYPRKSLAADWKYRLGKEGVTPSATANPEIYLLHENQEVIDAAIDARMKPGDYLIRFARETMRRKRFGDEPLSDFEDKVLYWRGSHGVLRDARNRDERFNYGDLYFFAVPGVPDLPLVLGDNRDTGEGVWGISKREPEAVFDPFDARRLSIFLSIGGIEKNIDSSERHHATGFDLIVDGFNLMVKRLENYLS